MELFELPIKGYLQLLEQLAKENTNLMKKNNSLFNEKSESDLSAREKAEYLNVLLRKNSKLSAENKKLRDIHSMILEFIKEFKDRISIETNEEDNYETELSMVNNHSIEQKESKLDKRDYLNKTISGDISLNNEHPFINDYEFLNLLLDYYTESEEYEKCSEIMSLKKAKIVR